MANIATISAHLDGAISLVVGAQNIDIFCQWPGAWAPLRESTGCIDHRTSLHAGGDVSPGRSGRALLKRLSPRSSVSSRNESISLLVLRDGDCTSLAMCSFFGSTVSSNDARPGKKRAFPNSFSSSTKRRIASSPRSAESRAACPRSAESRADSP